MSSWNPPKIVTSEWLKRASDRELSAFADEFARQSDWAVTALQTPVDGIATGQLIARFGKLRLPQRQRLIRVVVDQLAQRIVKFKRDDEPTIVLSDLAHRLVREDKRHEYVERLSAIWSSGLKRSDDRLSLICAKALAELNPVAAVTAIDAALPSSSVPHLLMPSLLEALAQVRPVEALPRLFDNVADPTDPGLIYAIDDLLRRGFRQGPKAMLKALPEASLSWPREGRELVGEIISDDDFAYFIPELPKHIAALRQGNPLPSARRDVSAWRRFVERSAEAGEVQFNYLAFAQANVGHTPRVLVRYRNELAGLVAKSAGQPRLKRSHTLPKEINRAVDDHFDGKIPMLDLQWNTAERAGRGDFLEFGVFRRFAIVCRSDVAEEFAAEAEVDEISARDALQEAQLEDSQYDDKSAILARLIELHNNETIELATQASSALNDLVADGLDTDKTPSLIRGPIAGTAKGDDVVDIMKHVLSSNHLVVGVIEWNPLRFVGTMSAFFSEARLMSGLEKFYRNGEFGFRFFRGSLETPLGAGYFAPRNDEIYLGAVREAARAAMTRRVRGGLEWTDDMRRLAQHSLVQLHPASQVFDPSEEFDAGANILSFPDTAKQKRLASK